MRLSAIFTFQNIFLFSAFHSVFRCLFPIKLCKNLCKITLKNPFYTVSDFPAFDYCPWQITLKKYMWHYATNSFIYARLRPLKLCKSDFPSALSTAIVASCALASFSISSFASSNFKCV